MWLDLGRTNYLDALARNYQVDSVKKAIAEEKETGSYEVPKCFDPNRFAAMVKFIKKHKKL